MSLSLYPPTQYNQPLQSTSFYGQSGYQNYVPVPAPVYYDSTSFRREFSNRLAGLTANSRPTIQNLFLFAHEHVRFSKIVSQCLEEHIRRIPPWMKLPSFYLLDMISKNVYKPYAHHFSAMIVPLFIDTYQQVDEATRRKMIELVFTWRTSSPSGKELFGAPAQVAIERSIWGVPSTSAIAQQSRNFSTPAGYITKSQVLSELHSILRQKQRAAQTNPTDSISRHHTHVLEQLRVVVEAGVSQDELQQILGQLRSLTQNTTFSPPPFTSSWPSQPSIPQSSAPNTQHSNQGHSTSTSFAGFSNLLTTLMKSGLVPSSNTTMPAETGVTLKKASATSAEYDAGGNEREYRASILSHDVQLSTIGLTRTRPDIHSLLYKRMPVQCKQCGIRFPETVDGKRQLEQHMDMHFRQNLKANEAVGRGYSRSWFLTRQRWAHDSVEHDRKGKGRAVDANKSSLKSEAELRSMFVVIPPGDEVKTIECPVCKEVLPSEFLEEEEEWVWKNATRDPNDERIYHATCHAEVSRSTGSLARLLSHCNNVKSRSRSATPESTVKSTHRLVSPPMAGRKRKVGDDSAQLEDAPPSKKLAIAAL